MEYRNKPTFNSSLNFTNEASASFRRSWCDVVQIAWQAFKCPSKTGLRTCGLRESPGDAIDSGWDCNVFKRVWSDFLLEYFKYATRVPPFASRPNLQMITICHAYSTDSISPKQPNTSYSSKSHNHHYSYLFFRQIVNIDHKQAVSFCSCRSTITIIPSPTKPTHLLCNRQYVIQTYCKISQDTDKTHQSK